jgi:hypothetical protein
MSGLPPNFCLRALLQVKGWCSSRRTPLRNPRYLYSWPPARDLHAPIGELKFWVTDQYLHPRGRLTPALYFRATERCIRSDVYRYT